MLRFVVGDGDERPDSGIEWTVSSFERTLNLDAKRSRVRELRILRDEIGNDDIRRLRAGGRTDLQRVAHEQRSVAHAIDAQNDRRGAEGVGAERDAISRVTRDVHQVESLMEEFRLANARHLRAELLALPRQITNQCVEL